MRKSQDYLMKCLFVLLFGFISLGAIGGCNNNGGGQDGTQALTENDFAEDPSIVADPTGGVVVKFLEHPDSEKPENDTGEIGNDVIPFKYKSTLEHTFCWEDDDPDAEHFMVLEDSDGNEIFLLDVNGECITVVLEAGDYVMIIHHDGRIETTHPIFIIPSQEDGVQANISTDGLIKNGKVLISNILQNLHNTITHNAKAQQTPKKNAKTLLKTDACPNCNLAGAKLKKAKLTGAVLTGADLSGADLTGAVLTGADLTGADLSGADLTGAVLSGADLSRAVLTGVTLGDTMFTSALWCDSLCTCGANSIDTCVGCASIDICTALAFCEADCDDGSVCTDDICDPTTFACTHQPVDCDDGISCTVDTCDPSAGCQITPDPTLCSTPDSVCQVRVCQVGVGCGTLNKAEGQLCANFTKTCQQGECLPMKEGDPCLFINSARACNEAAGNCRNGSCRDIMLTGTQICTFSILCCDETDATRANPCLDPACGPEGSCTTVVRPDGAFCRSTAIGDIGCGTCQNGGCVGCTCTNNANPIGDPAPPGPNCFERELECEEANPQNPPQIPECSAGPTQASCTIGCSVVNPFECPQPEGCLACQIDNP